MELKNCGFGTKAVHSGHPSDPHTGALVPPIFLSTTFKQESPGVHSGYEYSRSDNPTRKNFETSVATLENGKYGIAFASGCAASTALLLLCDLNSHIICIDDVYGGTNRLLNEYAQKKLNYEISFVDFTNPENIRSYIKGNTKVI